MSPEFRREFKISISILASCKARRINEIVNTANIVRMSPGVGFGLQTLGEIQVLLKQRRLRANK